MVDALIFFFQAFLILTIISLAGYGLKLLAEKFGIRIGDDDRRDEWE